MIEDIKRELEAMRQVQKDGCAGRWLVHEDYVCVGKPICSVRSSLGQYPIAEQCWSDDATYIAAACSPADGYVSRLIKALERAVEGLGEVTGNGFVSPSDERNVEEALAAVLGELRK